MAPTRSTADVGDVELGPVAHQQHDAGAAADAEVGQRGGEPSGAVGVLGEGERAVRVALLPAERQRARGGARTVARNRRGTVWPATRSASSAFVIGTAVRLTAPDCPVALPTIGCPSGASYPQDPVENPARVSGKAVRDGEYLAKFVPRRSLGRCASGLLYADTPRDALASGPERATGSASLALNAEWLPADA